jgi:AbrB family looped-hinge helix DNA binding protein
LKNCGSPQSAETPFTTLEVDDRTIYRMTNPLSIGETMEKVTISPKFQVVIPSAVRERLALRPGQQVQVIPYRNRIELIPLRPARELRGSLRGISTDLIREEDRL